MRQLKSCLCWKEFAAPGHTNRVAAGVTATARHVIGSLPSMHYLAIRAKRPGPRKSWDSPLPARPLPLPAPSTHWPRRGWHFWAPWGTPRQHSSPGQLLKELQRKTSGNWLHCEARTKPVCHVLCAQHQALNPPELRAKLRNGTQTQLNCPVPSSSSSRCCWLQAHRSLHVCP